MVKPPECAALSIPRALSALRHWGLPDPTITKEKATYPTFPLFDPKRCSPRVEETHLESPLRLARGVLLQTQTNIFGVHVAYGWLILIFLLVFTSRRGCGGGLIVIRSTCGDSSRGCRHGRITSSETLTRISGEETDYIGCRKCSGTGNTLEMRRELILATNSIRG